MLKRPVEILIPSRGKGQSKMFTGTFARAYDAPMPDKTIEIPELKIVLQVAGTSLRLASDGSQTFVLLLHFYPHRAGLSFSAESLIETLGPYGFELTYVPPEGTG